MTQKNPGKVLCTGVPAPSLPYLTTCRTQDDVSMPSSVACLRQIPTTPASEHACTIATTPLHTQISEWKTDHSVSLPSGDHKSATLKGLDETKHRSVPPYHQTASGELPIHPALSKDRQRFDSYDRPVMQTLEPSSNSIML